jgi:transaldolase
MLPMARRFHAWAPNIAVKLPATAAGLDVLEECVAEGIAVAATVSFTVPQAIAIAERHRAGALRAKEKGLQPGQCFAVIMIGRLDDFLREVAHDTRAAADESDIRQAGLAATKRAYAIYRERGYQAVLLIAALRGDYHLTELAGFADVYRAGLAGGLRHQGPPARGTDRQTGSRRCTRTPGRDARVRARLRTR